MARDWHAAGLGPVEAALCAWAEKLTRTPDAMREADLEPLRAVGLEDHAILSAAQVVGYFNYINRLADGLGVEQEEWLEAEG